MRTTIDAAGRLVVPKALREILGRQAGTQVLLQVRDGRLEVEPAPTPMRLVEGPDGVRAVAGADLPSLTTDQVRETLEQTRR
jgi:AbrB family looped-hinge helix DNA binding protein